MSFHLTYC